MDLECFSFSTADYSFHQDPSDYNGFDVDNITPDYPSTLDFTDTKYNSTLSLCTFAENRAGGYYYPVHLPFFNFFSNEPHSTIEVEFDEGVSPQCEDLHTYYICAESHPSVSTIGSFDLRDTVLYQLITK
jgi:hypothetical protein